MAFIVDRYNRYERWDREHARFVFFINDMQYAVKEVELDWGIPQLQQKVDRDMEQDAKQMYVYDTFEKAMEFVRKMKKLNAR